LSASSKDWRKQDGIHLDIQVKRVVSVKVHERVARLIESKYREAGFANRSDFVRSIISKCLSDGLKPADVRYVPAYASRCDVTLTFRLDSSVVEKIDEAAKKLGFATRSDFLRYVIYNFIQP